MSITALPDPPSTSDPANFATRADAFMAALPGFATEANALAAQMNANAADGTWAAASNIAAAATVNLASVATHYINVTGSGATISAFGTVAAGAKRTLKFAGANTITHNATSLIIPGAADLTTAAGDIIEVISEGSGNWRVLFHTKATSLIPGQGPNLTISGGAITVTHRFHVIDTEAAAAADDLDLINGGAIGDEVTLRSATGTRKPTIRDNAGGGNIQCGSNFTLDGTSDVAKLVKTNAGSWSKIAFSTN